VESLEEGFLRLKAKILSERNSKKNGRFTYSNNLISEVTEFLPKGCNFAQSANRLGVAECVLRRWIKRVPMRTPRRLVVSENLTVPFLANKLPQQTFDALLSNGVVLKGLPLTLENLQLLGRVL
jgi:hypothetical protein